MSEWLRFTLAIVAAFIADAFIKVPGNWEYVVGLLIGTICYTFFTRVPVPKRRKKEIRKKQ